jgi:hypothetical protein
MQAASKGLASHRVQGNIQILAGYAQELVPHPTTRHPHRHFKGVVLDECPQQAKYLLLYFI